MTRILFLSCTVSVLFMSGCSAFNHTPAPASQTDPAAKPTLVAGDSLGFSLRSADEAFARNQSQAFVPAD